VSYLLFADDNEDMRQMVRALLQPSGHEVGLAPDGPSALESIAQREPDLLLLDVDMPRMSGFEVCRLVKNNPFTSRIPVLMLTAEGDIDSKVEGFEAGADDYLAKPFDPRELRARVTALLRLVRREADRNPTSGLPGGGAIEENIAARVNRDEPFAVCYLDLDNFKAFADTFGFAVADQVIKEMGGALREAVDAAGNGKDFVGHIGGDDFLVVTTEAHGEAIAKESARRFREVVRRIIGDEALALGTFSGVDRNGALRRFPLARVSAAVLAVQPEAFVSMNHLGLLAAEVKRKAKKQGAGTILVTTV
jgi:PleD family two-component response regulator